MSLHIGDLLIPSVKIYTTTGSGGGNYQSKNINPTASQQIVTADSGYSALSRVTVAAIQTEEKTATANGIITPTTGKYLTKVTVNVPTGGSTITLQNKTVTPTESQQTINADSGYSGLGTVTVGAISPTYIGSSITQRSSTDLTVSGATITAPAGYYSSAASKSVAAMTLPTAISTSSSGTSAMSAIGRSTSTRYINIPAGYNSTAKYYTISAVANGTATNNGNATGTAATVSTGTNTLTLSKSVSITPTVTAGYISAGTAGNVSVSLTANITTKAAATITPSTSNQTIASGTYLTGTQTIQGDSNLVGSNILSGVSIFGVPGTVSFITYYTGSSAPSSSLGSNGDIYLQN